MPITSTDFDNAEIDLQTTSIVSNSKTLAGTPTDSTLTRLGDTVDTLNGRLKKLGYLPPIAYAGGIAFTALDNVKTVEESGSRYAPRIDSLPFTTSGTWIGDDENKFYLIEGATVNEISAEFETVADMVNGVTTSGTTIDWSDYEKTGMETVYHNLTSKAGCAKYIKKTVAQAAADGDVIDGTGAPNHLGRNHALTGGTHVAILVIHNNTLNLECVGVVTRPFDGAPLLADFTPSGDAFQLALNAADNSALSPVTLTWSGDFYCEKEIVVPRFGVTIRGAGSPHKSRILTFQTGTRDSGYIVFKHTDTLNCSDFSIVNTGDYIGFGFSTPQDNSSSSQANYCKFNNVQVLGFFNSWWFRASLWCSWNNCFSHSAAGVRFARNSDPYDRGTDDRNNNWNSFSPLGWFNNMNTFDTCVFEDTEVGVFGATMGTNFHNVTCQNQVGDPLLNEVIPTTESRTGVWLTSGRTGVRDGFNNTFTGTYYAEASDRPLYLQDQATVLIDAVFSQGGGTGDRRDVALHCDNSIVKCGAWTGQDWYTVALILENSSTFYGRVGGVATSTPKTVDATSLHYEKVEQEIYRSQYSFTTTSVTSKTLPFSLASRSHYRLNVAALSGGASVIYGNFHVYRHVSDATTAVVETSSKSSSFNIFVTGGQLRIDTTTATQLDFQVIIEESTIALTDVVAI